MTENICIHVSESGLIGKICKANTNSKPKHNYCIKHEICGHFPKADIL